MLPRDYARPALDKRRLGQLIDLISNIQVRDEDARSRDVLGRVYEYFLSQFASTEGKTGAEYYTSRCMPQAVEMPEPHRGPVYDPSCGSSGTFVQSLRFVRAHASGKGNNRKAKADIKHLRQGVELHDVTAVDLSGELRTTHVDCVAGKS